MRFPITACLDMPAATISTIGAMASIWQQGLQLQVVQILHLLLHLDQFLGTVRSAKVQLSGCEQLRQLSNRVFQRYLGGAADKEVIQHAGLDLVDRSHGVLKGGFLIGVHRGKARPLWTWCSSGGKGGSHRSPYDREGESSESSAVDCQDGVMTVRVDDSVGLHAGG